MWPKTTCFQPLLHAVLERLDHRAEADVALADLGARLRVGVAADEHGRAGGHVGERFEPRHVGQVVVERQVGRRLATADDGLAEGLHLGVGDGHRGSLARGGKGRGRW